MTSYIENALHLIGDLPKTFNDSQIAIAKIDQYSLKLCKMLDSALTDIINDKCPTMTKHEMILLRKVIEDLSDMKAQIALRIYDLIDHNIRIVDQEINVLEKSVNLNHPNSTPCVEETTAVQAITHRKRKNAKLENQESGNSTVNEPVYCICRRVAFGDMIACDNEDCKIEWFHFPCVNLTRQPRNLWLCSHCSNKRKK